jgi:hypothetical protein
MRVVILRSVSIAAAGALTAWPWHRYGAGLTFIWDGLIVLVLVSMFAAWVIPGQGMRGIPRKARELRPLPHSHRKVEP